MRNNVIILLGIIGLLSGMVFDLPILIASGDQDILLAQAVSEKAESKSESNPSEKEKPRIFERRGRRDPFDTILTPIDKKRKRSDPLPPDQIENTPEQELVALKQAQKHLALMKDIAVKVPQPQRDKALSGPYQKILDIYKALNETNYESVKTQMENIRQQAEKLFPGAERVYSQAEYLYAQASQNFAAGEFDNLEENLKEITNLPDRVEVKGTANQTKIQILVEKVKKLSQRAAIIKDFHAKNLEIDGIIFYTPIKRISLPPCRVRFFGLDLTIPLSYSKQVSASTVMINSSTYAEGESLAEGLIIKKIESNSVYFIYKGEEVKKGLE